MKNSFGSAITVTLFGESHGDFVGATLDGIAPGIKVERETVEHELKKRRPSGRISTARVEADEFIFASGVKDGKTTGTPLTVLIPNTNKRSGDYAALEFIPRPSHADYAASCKYHGFEDRRGGGHFSGRITSALVAVGAILKSALSELGIDIGTHISSLHGIRDRGFGEFCSDIAYLDGAQFPTLSPEAGAAMIAEGTAAAERGDSVGGVLETAVIGVPSGIGEPWFDTVEGNLAHILFSIPAVKGVEFGRGFGITELYGSEANDHFYMEGDKVMTRTNNSGGINGGITNGMPIIFRTAVKPTPSIAMRQESVDLVTGLGKELVIGGRHDPMIVHRARAVVDAVTAIAIADLLTIRFGTDVLREGFKK